MRDALIEELCQWVAFQSARISDLERRLGLNNWNSSKPSSRDGFQKTALGCRSGARAA